MRTASSIVGRLARKYQCNRNWLWEILDEYFNMRKGESAVMDPSEVEAFKEIIEDLLDT